MAAKLESGINHIEIWVSDMETSKRFYHDLFKFLQWHEVMDNAWACQNCEVYLREEVSTSRVLSLGIHHICFQAVTKKKVDEVGKWLASRKAKIFGGPIAMENYSPGYYTVDFYDPDGMILEVAYTPNKRV